MIRDGKVTIAVALLNAAGDAYTENASVDYKYSASAPELTKIKANTSSGKSMKIGEVVTNTLTNTEIAGLFSTVDQYGAAIASTTPITYDITLGSNTAAMSVTNNGLATAVVTDSGLGVYTATDPGVLRVTATMATGALSATETVSITGRGAAKNLTAQLANVAAKTTAFETADTTYAAAKSVANLNAVKNAYKDYTDAVDLYAQSGGDVSTNVDGKTTHIPDITMAQTAANNLVVGTSTKYSDFKTQYAKALAEEGSLLVAGIDFTPAYAPGATAWTYAIAPAVGKLNGSYDMGITSAVVTFADGTQASYEVNDTNFTFTVIDGSTAGAFACGTGATSTVVS